MNESASPPDSQELVFAAFVRAFEAADDRSAVLESYCRRHPSLAAELQSFAAMEVRLHAASPPVDEPPPRRLEPGQQLGDFRITRLIAAGGMGEVYQAQQAPLGRRVAVKVIRRGRIAADARERFRREQEMLAKLHQSHIVPIHTAGEVGDIQYFAMAYIDGAALNRCVDTAYERETSNAGKQTPSLRELAESASNSPVEELAPDLTAPYPAPPDPPRPPKDPSRRLRLSPAYFRSVAEVMAQAADAIQYAHDAGIYHRDIKPSNLMVDRAGHCWIIDFGLAGALTPPNTAPPAIAHAGAALTQSPMGTPQYMAPEQHQGRPEARSDVWALGATLYELLTLRRAFEGTHEQIATAVQNTEARPPRRLVPETPRDLEAICQKALRKNPADRYPSAAAFAADLRRWLGREPVSARPAWALRRVGLWARRNPGWATAIGFALVGLTAVGGATLEKTRDQRRELLMLEAQRTRLSSLVAGWRKVALDRLEDAAQIRVGADARDQAADALIGLDVQTTQEREWTVSSLARHDATGRWLLGGWINSAQGEVIEDAKASLWDPVTGRRQFSTQSGAGPVGFLADGTAAQLLVPTPRRRAWLLWDVPGSRGLHEWPLPPNALIHDNAAAAISDDGRVIALSMVQPAVPARLMPADPGQIDVYAADGKRLMRVELPHHARAVCVSPDGRLLAAGSQLGDVTVWSIPEGRVLFRVAQPGCVMTALTFGRLTARRRTGTQRPAELENWLLAAGTDGGSITTWELETGQTVSQCHGSYYTIGALAFSPDGTLIASGTLYRCRIWDVARGHQLVVMHTGGGLTAALRFAPSGDALTVGVTPAFQSTHGALWEYQLVNGDSITTLFGLQAGISHVRLSPDGRLVAALSLDWRVGVWDRQSGQLLHRLEVPPGNTAVNADIAFSPTGDRLVVASGMTVTAWDLQTGKEIQAWSLPPGLCERLAVLPNGHIALIRCELASGSAYPTFRPSWKDHPRVVRVRELAPGGLMRDRWTFTDLARHTQYIYLADDATLALVHGHSASAPLNEYLVYDLANGRLLFRLENIANAALADGGKLLYYLPARDAVRATVLNLPAGTIREQSPYPFPYRDRVGSLTVMREGERGLMVWRVGSPQPIVQLENTRTIDAHQLTSVGGQSVLCWGSQSGEVRVARMDEVRKRLTALGLGMGW